MAASFCSFEQRSKNSSREFTHVMDLFAGTSKNKANRYYHDDDQQHCYFLCGANRRGDWSEQRHWLLYRSASGLVGIVPTHLLGCRNEQLGAQAVQSLHAQLPSTVHVSSSPLTIGDETSHAAFAESVEQRFGKVDVLVNNAGFAFKGSDPTPFEGQTKPTLDINYYGTVDFTEKMLPLLKKGQDPRLVNVASMSGRLRQLSPALQAQFASPDLDMPQLHSLVKDFETSVADGTYQTKGWSNSNYGISKLALVAATKVWARQHPDIAVNCCCPGYCKTDMTSQRGMRDPAEGARNAVIPATMDKPPTGAFFADFEVAKW